MKTPSVKTKFTGYSDANLNTDSRNIIDRMTNNANFPTPVQSLTDVNTAYGDFVAALPLAQTGDRSKIAAKNCSQSSACYQA